MNSVNQSDMLIIYIYLYMNVHFIIIQMTVLLEFRIVVWDVIWVPWKHVLYNMCTVHQLQIRKILHSISGLQIWSDRVSLSIEPKAECVRFGFFCHLPYLHEYMWIQKRSVWKLLRFILQNVSYFVLRYRCTHQNDCLKFHHPSTQHIWPRRFYNSP